MAATTVDAATVTDLAITLRWSDNSDNEQGFEIERSKDSLGFTTFAMVAADETQFSDNALESGSSYAYRVRAFNDYGYSEYTNEVVINVAADGQNGPPSLSVIDNVSVLRGDGAGIAPFSISDEHVSLDALSFEFTSSNATLLPVSNIDLLGSGPDRSLILLPATGIGSSLVSVTASNGFETATASFTFTVLQNQAPTISSIKATSTSQATPTGPLAFTVSDSESPAGSLIVLASSDNTTLLPNSGLKLGGSGANRTITATPQAGQSGKAKITLAVSDGVNQSYTAFDLTVNPNTAPIISKIANQTISLGESISPLAFTVSDAETSAGSLQITTTTSNASLLPALAINLSGSGSSRSVKLNPMPGIWGIAAVTITVSDGALQSTSTFNLNVQPSSETVFITNFRIESDRAVTEARTIPNKSMSLWRSSTLESNTWTQVESAQIVVGSEVTRLVDPAPEFPMFYRVVATDETPLNIDGKTSTLLASQK